MGWGCLVSGSAGGGEVVYACDGLGGVGTAGAVAAVVEDFLVLYVGMDVSDLGLGLPVAGVVGLLPCR